MRARNARDRDDGRAVTDLDAEILEAFLERLDDLPDIDPETAVVLRERLTAAKTPTADQLAALLAERTGEPLA